MQPIERYGLVTLLFVVVAVVAVLAWDGPEEDGPLDERTARVDAPRSDAGTGTERNATRAMTERADTNRSRGDARTTPPVEPKAEVKKPKEQREKPRRDKDRDANQLAGQPSDGGQAKQRSGNQRPGSATYNPFGGNAARGGDANFVAEVDDAAGVGLSGIPAGDRASDADASTIDGIRGPRGVEDARRERVEQGSSIVTNGLGAGAADLDDRSRSTTLRDDAAAGSSVADASAAVPTGPFVVDAVLSKQLAREYGSDYALFGSKGLVSAFEAANPGVDVNRLGIGDTLRRPAPQRVAAARKSTSASTATTNTATANRSSSSSTLGGALSYEIRSGDTLSGIALATLGSASAYPQIEALNPGIDAGNLQVGSTILLPSGANASAPRATSVASAAPAVSKPAPADDRPRIR